MGRLLVFGGLSVALAMRPTGPGTGGLPGFGGPGMAATPGMGGLPTGLPAGFSQGSMSRRPVQLGKTCFLELYEPSQHEPASGRFWYRSAASWWFWHQPAAEHGEDTTLVGRHWHHIRW